MNSSPIHYGATEYIRILYNSFQREIDTRMLYAEDEANQNSSDGQSVSEALLDVQLVGESMLHSVFKRNGKLTNHMAVKLESMFFSALKRYDHGPAANSPERQSVSTIDVAVEMFRQMSTCYSRLLVGVIPPTEHERFFHSPEDFCRDNEPQVPDFIRRKLSLLTLGHSNSWNLSKAMTKLIRTAAAADIENGRIF